MKMKEVLEHLRIQRLKSEFKKKIIRDLWPNLNFFLLFRELNTENLW